MVFHAPDCASPDYCPLSILETALLRGQSSRLYRRLVREEQLAISVSGGIGETIDPLLFTITVKPRPGADLDKLEAVIGEELAKIKNEGITDQEYQKALNIVRVQFYQGLQTISGKAGQMGSAEIFYGSYEKLFTRMDDFIKVKRDQVKEAAMKYFTDDNKTVGKLVPAGGAK
jgi:predicted Zn-dependent peptidase